VGVLAIERLEVVAPAAAPGDVERSAPRSPRSLPATIVRALALWPGLDRVALARTHGDPVRIARLVARRTALPETAIVEMLGDR